MPRIRERLGAVVVGVLPLLTGCSMSGNAPDPPPAPQTTDAVGTATAAATPNCGHAFAPEPTVPDSYTVHLGAVALPTEVRQRRPLEERNSITTPDGSVYYFIKAGLPVRTQEAVTISAVDGSALLDWLGEGPQRSQRLGPCGPPDLWFTYGPGGFYVPREGCYEFRVQVGQQSTTARIPVHADC